MIIKGKSRNNAAQAGNYLSTLGKNERVELIETRGTLAENVKDACKEMEALAAATNCDKFLYHASINPAQGENLTPEQWQIAVDTLEKKLGLEGHQRLVVEHEKDGRTHRHILWSRVDPETLTATRMSWNYVQHEKTAREIEKAFQLEKVQGVHTNENGELREKDDPRATYAPTRKETENAKKSGVNLKKWQKEIRGIAHGYNGAELIAALEAKGHMVAVGDKVSFIILDPSGQPHRMAQRLGLSPDDLKERLSNIDPASLPREAEAREQQKEQQAQLEKEKGFTMYDRGGMVSQQADAMRHIEQKQKSQKLRTAREVFEEMKRGQTVEVMRAAGREAGNRKEKEQQPQQQSQTDERTPRVGSFSQRESLLRDIVPQIQKRATTEQTDRKQQKSAKEAMKEVFEKDFSKSRTRTGRDPRDNDDRERERER